MKDYTGDSLPYIYLSLQMSYADPIGTDIYINTFII